ncbi:hypothetical protein D9M73_112180 [compost metagenome]
MKICCIQKNWVFLGPILVGGTHLPVTAKRSWLHCSTAKRFGLLQLHNRADLAKVTIGRQQQNMCLQTFSMPISRKPSGVSSL